MLKNLAFIAVIALLSVIFLFAGGLVATTTGEALSADNDVQFALGVLGGIPFLFVWIFGGTFVVIRHGHRLKKFVDRAFQPMVQEEEEVHYESKNTNHSVLRDAARDHDERLYNR